MSRPGTKLGLAATFAGIGIAAIVWLVVGPNRDPSPRYTTNANSEMTRSVKVQRSPKTGAIRWSPDEPSTAATPLRARRPSTGEGAVESPELHADPAAKLDDAIATYESELEAARTAGSEEDSVEALDAATAALSSVRAEMFATEGGEQQYVELQTEIEALRPG